MSRFVTEDAIDRRWNADTSNNKTHLLCKQWEHIAEAEDRHLSRMNVDVAQLHQ